MESHQVIEFDVPELVELRDRVCKQHGWEPLSFRFVVYGRSPEAKAT
jgi:Fe2+ or Zn2+ uptake regulation protein